MTCNWFNTKPFISTKSGLESDLQNGQEERTSSTGYVYKLYEGVRAKLYNDSIFILRIEMD